MAENYPFPIYFILLIITIPRLISTVGKTEQWKSSSLPTTNYNISQKLINDPKSIELASSDYGNLVHDLPTAVFRPSTVNDIVSLVKLSFNSSVPFLIAARGQGHSTRGQAMARDGVVVDMKGLRKNNNIKNVNDGVVGIKVFEDAKVVDVGGEQLWIDVLYETLEYGLAPVSWTDYLYLTIGGTLSNAGISGQTFRYGPQITSVHQLDVVTGMHIFFSIYFFFKYIHHLIQVLETVSCVRNIVRMRTIHQNNETPFIDPAYAGALVHRAVLYTYIIWSLL